MNPLQRIMRGAERRATTLAQPADWFSQALTNGGSSYAGKSVTVANSLGLAPFYRGVQLLSGSVSQLPCKVYVRTPNGREEAPSSSRTAELLREAPNENMAPDEFWAIVETHLDTWGNAFVFKERGGDGRIANLWPLAPSRVAVGQLSDGRLTYVVDGKTEQALSKLDILHFRGLSANGVLGYSPVQIHRQTLGGALAQQEFQGSFWANDATPGVTLIHPNDLSNEAIERVRALWDGRHKGPGKARATAVLGDKIDVKNMTMPMADAQFIEQKQYSATEQALILGVPPHQVGGSVQDSLTYATVEGQSVDFLKFSVGPRLVRIQSALTRDEDLMPTGWYAEFDPRALLRTTSGERFDAYRTALDPLTGWMRRDEVRGLENLPAEEETDEQRLSLEALTIAVQKIYLGVGKVLTSEEAREILNRYGAGLAPGGLPEPASAPAGDNDDEAGASGGTE